MHVKHKNSSMPPVELVASRVAYDAETGDLVWRHCDASTFVHERAWKIWSKKFAGKKVGKVSRGYVIVTISHGGGTHYLQGHRVAWALTHGAWPEREIDHIDGNKSNNSMRNLRESTHEQNQRNKGRIVTNRSGHKGVHQHSQNGNWIAQIRVGGRARHLGSFGAPEDAALAYRAAAIRHHQEFARHA